MAEPTKAIKDILAGGLDRLPALPALVHRLMQLLDNQDATAAQVAELVEQEPAIALRVMRIANSAYFAPAQPEATVLGAVIRIGLSEVRGIVLLEALRQTLPSRHKREYRAYWEHSLSVALTTKTIMLRSPFRDKFGRAVADSLFTSGLLHDIGVAMFLTLDAAMIDRLKDRGWSSVGCYESLEQEIFGISHIRIGALLCAKWDLPAAIAAAVEYHAHPEKAPAGTCRTVAQIVHIADHLCMAREMGDLGDSALATTTSAWHELGFQSQHLDLIFKDLEDLPERLRAFS